MTLGQLYRKGRSRLAMMQNESPSFDALCLFQFCFGLDRAGLAIHGGENVRESDAGRFLELIRRRSEGEPLQYLLGEWTFMGLPFFVGEGVLIPREETELLVTESVQFTKTLSSPLVLELCAGSGAVCVSLQKQASHAQVAAVELSDKAISYLEKNIRRHHATVSVIKTDVLQPPPKGIKQQHVLLANPPYVTTEEMKGLSREVKREPEMALWGGDDGLTFYRAILSYWLPLLLPGGLLAVECGKGQAKRIADMMEQAGLTQIQIKSDFNGINRLVRGEQRK